MWVFKVIKLSDKDWNWFCEALETQSEEPAMQSVLDKILDAKPIKEQGVTGANLSLNATELENVLDCLNGEFDAAKEEGLDIRTAERVFKAFGFEPGQLHP